MIEIKVPATSANLGSGFDSLGLAVQMYNRVWMEPWEGVSVESLDGAPIPTDEHNLVYRTAKDLFETCGRKLPGLRIRQESAIPMARGLGSSSACVVAGLMGANQLMGSPLSKTEIIHMAANIEGHPDNSTPAILGGQVTAALEGGQVYYCRHEIARDLKLVAIIPDFELKTSLARAALPPQVDHRDAVYNLSRAALMAMSLASGQYGNLKVACQDSLHQPYRLGLIANGEAAIRRCMEEGAYGAYISGAGSTLMAMVPSEDGGFVPRLRSWLDGQGCLTWQVLALEADNSGAEVSEVS